jgi:hypothetical protein
MKNPSICPVCSGRGSVPADLYDAALSGDWEPGDLPHIRSECGETECASCEGLGVVWPPLFTSAYGTADGSFRYTGESSEVLVNVTSPVFDPAFLYEWEEATEPEKVGLTLVEPKPKKEN